MYEELSSPLKHGYHKRIAEKLESTNPENPPLSDLAYHYAQAGNIDKSVEFSFAAGIDELTKFSRIEAIKHFQYVIQAVGENKKYIKEKETALESLGDAFRLSSMYKESIKAYDELATSTRDDNLKFRVYKKAMDSGFHLGDAHCMMEFITKAEPLAAGDRLKNGLILLEKGRVSLFEGKNFTWLKDFEESFQILEEETSFGDVSFGAFDAWVALLGVAGNHPRIGKFRESIAESLLMIAWAEERFEPGGLQAAYAYAGNNFNECFLSDEALIILAKPKRTYQKTKTGVYSWLFIADIFSAWTLMQKADFPEALSHALAAYEFSKKTDATVEKAIVYSTLTRVYALLGDADCSNDFFAKLTKLPPEVMPYPYVFVNLTKAVHLAVNGQWDESNRIFQENLVFGKISFPMPTGRLL